MPDREHEGGWEAIVRVLEPTAAVTMTQKIAAAWKFHQYCLHSIDNHISDADLAKMEKETLSLLSEDEKERLRDTHHFLTPHEY